MVADESRIVASLSVMRAQARRAVGAAAVRELGEWVGHAEREAMRDAQRRIGEDLSGCVMVSTSHPCGSCQRTAAQARLSRMYYGADATDAGKP